MSNHFKVDLSTARSEADVENKIIIPLLKEAGIIKENKDYSLRVPVKMTLGRQSVTKEADIVVYKNKKPFIVIEAKSKGERLDDDEIAQLDSYAVWLPAPYGIICNGLDFVLRGYLSGNEKVYLIKKTLEKLDLSLVQDAITDNQEGITFVPQRLIADQSESFSSLLREIHQKIRDIDHLGPTDAFDGWSKLLFMKIYEDKWASEHGGNYRLSYKRFIKEKKDENAINYITARFNDTCNAYPKIFGDNPNEEIGLSLDAIEEILSMLDGYNIKEIPMDVKGKAYEIFLHSTFRGKGLGQFFTPRPVVDFMVNLVDFRLDTILLDPACGTGGFLIKGYQRMKELAIKTPDHVYASLTTTKKNHLANIKDNQIYGIDAEPRATKTAKMNMIMWGDGENVVKGNGLDVVDDNHTPYPFQEGTVSLILANPPFGNKEKKPEVLSQFTLFKEHSIDKTECLFLEKAIRTLKAEGEMAIVIPDGVLVCSNTSWVRRLIQKYCKIKAVISLPKHTFAPSGVQTISTSVLYVQKYSQKYLEELAIIANDEDLSTLRHKYGFDNYNIFMGVAQEIGYEPNGRPTRSGQNDLDELLKKYELAKSNCFYSSSNFKTLGDNCLVINSSLIEGRLDARYYWFMNKLKEMAFEKVPLGNYIEIKSRTFSPKEQSPEESFSIVSVTNNYGIILDEDDEKKFEVDGININKAKKVKAGDVAFNPYRVNVGSIGIVSEEYNDFLISPAYVVFRTKNGLDSRVLCALFKNNFYNLYIDIIGLGSIRTSLSATKLRKILIPKSLIEGDTSSILSNYNQIDKLKELITQQNIRMQQTISHILQ